MIEFTLLLSSLSFVLSSYLFALHVRRLVLKRRYRRWLSAERARIAAEGEEEKLGIVREITRTYPIRETSEEREWRVEQRLLSAKRDEALL